MKSLPRLILVFLVLLIAWQITHTFIAPQEQAVRSEIRHNIENEFPTLATQSKQRFGIQQLNQPNNSSSHILLVHGLDDPGKVWMNLAPELINKGYNVWQLTYPNDQAIQQSAKFLNQQLAFLYQSRIKNLTIIAHSMGGLVSREALTNSELLEPPDAKPEVDQLIMVATPNHGSQLARFRLLSEIREQLDRLLRGEAQWLDAIADGAGEAGIDLLPNSTFLTALNARVQPQTTRYHIIAGIIGNEERLALKKQLGQHSEYPSIVEIIDKLSEKLGDGLVTLESVKLNNTPVEIVPGNHLSIIRNVSSTSNRVPPAIPVILSLLAKKK